MRYGRRRRGFPWARATLITLALLGAVALLLGLVNWRSMLGLYRVNLVGGTVKRLTGTVEFDPERLRARRLSAAGARSWLERGLTDLGVPVTLSAGR